MRQITLEGAIRAAERITGHTIIQTECTLNITCKCEGVARRFTRLRSKEPWKVVEALVVDVYRHHSRIVMARQDYRCAECEELGRLEIDHIVPRARGRDDRIENLRAVCAGMTGCQCHAKKHGG